MVSTLPIITQVSPLTVADCVEMPYSPVLLLDSKFDVSITDDPAFREACEDGFGGYFEGMYEMDEEQEESLFVARCYSWAEVVEWVVDNALSEEKPGRLLPCVERAGYALGWLSALALTDRSTARRALTVLEALLAPSEKCLRRGLVA